MSERDSLAFTIDQALFRKPMAGMGWGQWFPNTETVTAASPPHLSPTIRGTHISHGADGLMSCHGSMHPTIPLEVEQINKVMTNVRKQERNW
jgi:hypothetical protein